MALPIEYAVLIPTTVIGAVKFCWVNDAVEVECEGLDEEQRAPSWCRRWKHRFNAGAASWAHILLDTLLFCFLVFYVISLIAIDFETDPGATLADEGRRREFVGRMFAIGYTAGAFVFLVCMEYAVVAAAWMTVATPISRWFVSSGAQDKWTNMAFSGGGAAVLVAVLLLLASFVMYACISKLLLTLNEAILVGFALGLSFWMYVYGWDYFLLREGDNTNVYWGPVLTSLVIAGVYLMFHAYKMCKRQRRFLYHKQADEATSDLAHSRRRRDSDEEEEEHHQDDDGDDDA